MNNIDTLIWWSIGLIIGFIARKVRNDGIERDSHLLCGRRRITWFSKLHPGSFRNNDRFLLNGSRAKDEVSYGRNSRQGN